MAGSLFGGAGHEDQESDWQSTERKGVFMIRYFHMPATRNTVALVIEPGSAAETATPEQMSRRFGVELQEISRKEYRRLTELYETEAARR